MGRSPAPLRVLALASYPSLVAATRYRLDQFRGPLAERNVVLEVRPFLDDEGMRQLYGNETLPKITAVTRGLLTRAQDVTQVSRFDVVIVQREAMLVGPPVVEWFLKYVGRRPLVVDIDDAIWLPERTLVPPLLAKVRRWPGKIDWLLANATLVTCGNRFLADRVRSLGQTARVVPNAVDTTRFRPASHRASMGRPPLVGWIGSHGTYPYLEDILPLLEEVGRQRPFRMLVVGSNQASLPLRGVPVELRPFDLSREVDDFASLDIGLYPLADDPWSAGKSGLKAIQYLAVGVPFVASPVGIVSEIGVPGSTHFLAPTETDWQTALMALLQDPALRAEMGAAGRRHAEVHHGICQSVDALGDALREAADG